jgi:hypothetical protein
VRGLRREAIGATLDGMRTAASLNSDLDFYVDITVDERDGRHMATAILAKDSRRSPHGHHPEVYRFGPSANLTRLG